MKMMAIHKHNTSLEGAPLFTVGHACHFWSRLKGLLGRSALAAEEGLLITPCNQVHTIGMRFPIDVLFLDAQGKVLKCVPQLKPFRVAGSRKAIHTLEVLAGSIAAHGIKTGQQLRWRNTAVASQISADQSKFITNG